MNQNAALFDSALCIFRHEYATAENSGARKFSRNEEKYVKFVLIIVQTRKFPNSLSERLLSSYKINC